MGGPELTGGPSSWGTQVEGGLKSLHELHILISSPSFDSTLKRRCTEQCSVSCSQQPPFKARVIYSPGKIKGEIVCIRTVSCLSEQQ